jgi:hypothetical protein
MSSDRGDAVDPNDPYRTPPPAGSGPGASSPGYGPSGYETTPSGYEGRGEPAGPPPYASSSASEPPYGTSPQSPYGSSPYGSSPYGTQRTPGTDGFAIAALVTGLLTMGIVPIVLGIIALSRIKRSGQDGRGLAIAGIVLGVIGLLFWLLVIGGAIAFFTAFESGGFETYGLGIAASGVVSPG